uniref:Uncharacterized protein n=1 Tax=Panagrolaimus sp. JU765 TaxID=591449 RepID=A0AC34QV20_9BILA
MSFDSEEDQYHRSNVQQLKTAYLEQIRRDAQRHAYHRTTPIIGVAGGSRASLGHVTPLLPDIQEAAHEGSSASSVTTQASLERRRSSFVSESEHQERRSQQEFESYRLSTPLSSAKRSNSQLLYPPGSTDQVLSEHTLALRPPEKLIYENKPLAPSVLAVNISQASTSQQERSTSVAQGRIDRQPYQPSTRHPEDEFSERLMSPPPGRQTPKPILKQGYIQQQYYSDQEQTWEEKSQYYHQQEQKEMHDSYSRIQDRPESSQRASNRTPAHYGSNYELDEAERFRIMQENLRKHREQRSYTPQNVPKYPATSFNGPFFKLEEVTPGTATTDRPRSQSVAPVSMNEQRRYEEEMRYQYDQSRYQEADRVKQISSSEMELNRHQTPANDGVVIWPPPSKDRPRPASAMAKSILDPERIDEFRKQKHLEMEAMRRRDQREMYLRQKQFQAMQMQQQRLYEQRQQLISEQPELQTPQFHPSQNVPIIHTLSPTEELAEKPYEEPAPVRVFETRPISVMSGESTPDVRDMTSPGNLNTWRRTYVLDKQPEVVAKNEILTSETLLEKERFEVDLLKRREAFIEKVEEEPQIFRTGKRWQPPPEKPYIWPTLRRPVTVDPGEQAPMDFSPGVPDAAEYRWQPVIFDPGYKKEHKNFTPTNSPPHSPRRGHGTGPLDDVAKRQTKYVVQPSPDGSHRPKPAFKASRHAPSGGFVPHAPNSIKIVKKRSSQIHNTLIPDMVDQEIQDIEVIHEKNMHDRRRSHSQSRSKSLNTQQSRTAINDWEKIYDLPPHASTVTSKDVPSNVDVRRRLQLFELQASQRRAYSEQRGSSSQLHSTSSTPKPPQIEASSRTFANMPQTPNGGTLLRRVDSRGESHQHRHKHRSERTTSGDYPRSRHTSHSEIPTQHVHYPQSSASMMPSRHEEQARPASVASQRRLQRIVQATQPSPAPPSYDRARPYVPPPLPPGYKRPPSPQYGYQQISPRSPPPQQPGNTRRLVQLVQHAAQSSASTLQRTDSHRAQQVQSGIHAAEYAPAALEPKKNDDLDELARKNRELAERSKNRRNDFTLIGSDIVKTNPEPLPAHYKDASSATWQFNSFSPKSAVSMNGAKVDEGLLKVRTTIAASEVCCLPEIYLVMFT